MVVRLWNLHLAMALWHCYQDKITLPAKVSRENKNRRNNGNNTLLRDRVESLCLTPWLEQVWSKPLWPQGEERKGDVMDDPSWSKKPGITTWAIFLKYITESDLWTKIYNFFQDTAGFDSTSHEPAVSLQRDFAPVLQDGTSWKKILGMGELLLPMHLVHFPWLFSLPKPRRIVGGQHLLLLSSCPRWGSRVWNMF